MQTYSFIARRLTMTSISTDYDAARAALTRLLPLAMSDTGQARRVANFLIYKRFVTIIIEISIHLEVTRLFCRDTLEVFLNLARAPG